MRPNTKEFLREQRLAPKKWLGQTLLTDSNYLKKIVQSAKILAGDPIVEIGSGLGALTDELISQGAEVWGLEIDSGFFRVLKEKYANNPKAHLIHDDALRYDFTTLAQRLGKLRVVANLPYSVSSRLLFRIYQHRDVFRSAHVMLQREVAERLVADRGNKDYGILSILFSATAVVDLLFDVPAEVFFPRPAVVSTVVHIRFPDTAPVSIRDSHLFTAVVKAAFHARRKTLRNNFCASFSPRDMSPKMLQAAAERAGIDLGRRGETLSAEEFALLAEQIAAVRKFHIAGNPLETFESLRGFVSRERDQECSHD